MTRYDPRRHHRRSIRLKEYDYSRPGAYFVTICTQGGEALFGQVRGGRMRLNPGGEMVWRWWRRLNDKYPSVRTDAAVVMPNHFHGIIVITGRPHANPDTDTDGHAIVGATDTDMDGDVMVPATPTRIDGGTTVGATPCGRPHDGHPHANPHIETDGHATAPGQPRGAAPTETDGHAIVPATPTDTDGNAIVPATPTDTDGDAIVGATPRGRPQGGRPQDRHPQANPDDPPPTLGQIVGWFKTMTTNEYIRGVKQRGWPPFPGKVWQRNYYEHIIRNQEALEHIRAYIQTNPERWALDRQNPQRTGLDEWESWIYGPCDDHEG